MFTLMFHAVYCYPLCGGSKMYLATIDREPTVIFIITVIFLTLFVVAGIRQAIKGSGRG